VNALQKLGAIMIILGIVLPFLGIALPSLATVYYYSPPSIVFTKPSSTSSSSPDAAMVAQSYNFIVGVAADAGIKSATVDVYRASDNARLVLFTMSYSSYDEGIYYYSYTWTLPSTPTSLKCIFTATDNAGQTVSKTAYLNVVYASGDFYINNQKATQTSTIVVNNPTLSLKFVPADATSASSISSVVVYVFSDSGTQLATVSFTKNSDSTWSASYTLPAKGKYRLDGYFWCGNQKYQAMSVTIPFGSETLNIPDMRKFINVFTIFGVLVYAFGSLQKKRW